MPTVVSAVRYWKGTVNINYGQYGWSETIDIKDDTEANVKLVMLKYIRHRMWLLPATCSAVYARVVRVPFTRYGIAIDNLPIVGKAPNLTAPNVLDMDSVERAACFHLPVDLGAKSIRFIHGLPDDAITAQGLVTAAPGGTWLDLVTDPGDGTATPATLAAAIKTYLSYLLQMTYVATQKQVRLIADVATDVWDLRIFTGLLLRGVRNRKVGRSFGLSRGRAAIH